MNPLSLGDKLLFTSLEFRESALMLKVVHEGSLFDKILELTVECLSLYSKLKTKQWFGLYHKNHGEYMFLWSQQMYSFITFVSDSSRLMVRLTWCSDSWNEMEVYNYGKHADIQRVCCTWRLNRVVFRMRMCKRGPCHSSFLHGKDSPILRGRRLRA